MDVELKQIIVSWARKLNINCKVYLFGSQSRGTARKESDIDIMMEFPNMSQKERLLFWFDNHEKWEQELSKKIGSKVDLELYEGENSPRLKKALNESSILLFSSS